MRTPLPVGLLLGILVGLLAFSVTYVPIRADNDCWWHVKTGKYIAENGIPRNDVFSYTAEDHKWDNHEWATQVAMWKAYEWGEATGFGGWRGVILLTTLTSVAAWYLVAWLGWRRTRNWAIAALIAIVAVAIGRRTVYPRPPVLTYALYAFSLYVLYEVRLGRWPLKRLAILVPLMAAWANLHGGWMALLVSAGFFGIDAAWKWWSLRRRLGADSPRVRKAWDYGIALGILIVALVIASGATPFGYRIYLLPGRVMSDRDLVASIGELQPPNYYFTVAFGVAVAVGALAAVVPALFRRRMPFTVVDLLLFAFWAWQGMKHVRHLPMFAVAAAPLLAVLGRELLRRITIAGAAGRPLRISPPAMRAGLNVALACFGGWLAVYVFLNPRESESYGQRNAVLASGTAYIAEKYPSRVCDFVLLNNIRGRMFNMNSYAGYLIWRLAPEQTKVFTDSRFDIFGGAFLRDEWIIGGGMQVSPELSWKTRMDHWKIDWALIPDSMKLNEVLETLPAEWERVYLDPVVAPGQEAWAIWIRKTPETEAMRTRARNSMEAIRRAVEEARRAAAAGAGAGSAAGAAPAGR